MISISCLLFDLDGTLIDSRADLARSVNLTLADLGRRKLDESDIAGFVGDGVWVLIRRCLKAADPEIGEPGPELHRQALALLRKHYSEQMLVKTDLYPNVRETLSRFDGKKIALVTSKESDFARQLLEHFGLMAYFDCVIGGDTLPERKPDPKPVMEAMRKLGCSPGDAVMVGDSENDIIAGRSAGTRTCAVTYGFRTREQLVATGPDVVIDGFGQLEDYFV
ncbi:MAG TPA: HAD family hydrolase [Blastocatellia bacterium]|nr:HAD family hydrolase [Blastocatellia bacterium]